MTMEYVLVLTCLFTNPRSNRMIYLKRAVLRFSADFPSSCGNKSKQQIKTTIRRSPQISLQVLKVEDVLTSSWFLKAVDDHAHVEAWAGWSVGRSLKIFAQHHNTS